MDILQVMNFLNEVAERFPDAKGISEQAVEQKTCEYDPSGGIINSIIRQHLACDQSIEVVQDDIIVTNGFQEAATLICLHELGNEKDCILTLNPSYIGLSAMVLSIGKKVASINTHDLCTDHGSFDFDEKAVFECAESKNVICMPESFFCLDPEPWQRKIRLLFSYYQPDQLREGIKRLARYLKIRLAELSGQCEGASR